MTDAELDELVRRNYHDANKSYLLEQKRIAERIVGMKDESMFVLTEDGEGKWEKYDDTYDITIHCRSKEENEQVMKIINEASKLLKARENK